MSDEAIEEYYKQFIGHLLVRAIHACVEDEQQEVLFMITGLFWHKNWRTWNFRGVYLTGEVDQFSYDLGYDAITLLDGGTIWLTGPLAGKGEIPKHWERLLCK